MGNEKWILDLKVFIDSILILKDDDRKLYYDEKYIEIWKNIFSQDLILSNDYNKLRFIGNKIFGHILIKYLMKNYQHLDREEYTNISNFYMNKQNLIAFSRKIGFTKFLLNSKNLEITILEAFLGALDKISDDISFGLGYINCYNFIDHIFKDIKIDKNYRDPKTEANQIFNRLNLPNLQESIHVQNMQRTITIKFDPKHITFLNLNNIKIKNQILVKSSESSNEAYEIVLTTLEKYGINTDWAKNYKNKQIFDTIPSYLPKMYSRMKNEGYTDIKFITTPNDRKYDPLYLIQLIGININKQESIINYILTPKSPNMHTNIKSLLLKNYVLTYKV